MNKILLIDYPQQRRQDFARFLSGFMPDLDITQLDTASGIPSEDFPWSEYDLILMNYDLGNKEVTGFDWLQTIRMYPFTPPVSILFDDKDVHAAQHALRMGAVSYIIRTDNDKHNLIMSITELLNPHDLDSPADQAVLDLTDENMFEDFENTKPEHTFECYAGKNIYPIIPGYEITEFIAEGGMAEVLLARNEQDGNRVILKIMHLTGDEYKEGLKRFINEYNLLSNIDHPHIIKIYERAFAADFAYIAMEYLPEGDLNKRIKKGIAPDTALEYLRQMASGLQAAHELNIIHRDLKPGNILFREDGTLTISDFGVAKTISGDSRDITVDNMVVGTPYYLSPEQGAGLTVDNRSDLYSLGVIFYQMLTGKRPYTASSISQLLYAHMNNPIPMLRGELNKYQPLIEGLLAKEPDERFQSAGDLLLGIDWVK